MRKVVLASVSVAALAALTPTGASAGVACTDLAGQALLSPGVSTATSVVVPASGPTPAYCKVDLAIVPGSPAINIRVGLPVAGWNGKVRNLGGGGCAGSVGAMDPAIQTNYVGSSTDTGHVNFLCEEAVNLDHTINLQYVNDFIQNSEIDQIRWAKRLATMFYGTAPTRNYWDGCSTGGRQGMMLAQKVPDELDGILAGAPAFYWTKFQTAQMWGQIAMKDLAGGPIASTKLAFATSSAVAACDASDGVADGVIDDPRTCSYSATALICVANGGPSSDPNCLTPNEATAINKIWDGPRNTLGKKIWFGEERGAQLGGPFTLNDVVPFFLGVTQTHWNELDRTFDWHTVTMFGAGGTKSYAQLAQDGSNTFGDLTNTQQPDLTKFRDAGGKLLMWQGMADQLIYPRGSIDYYRRASGIVGGYANLQSWFRYFRAPGVGHCGGGAGAQPQSLFDTMVAWRETGVAPASITALGGAGAPPTRSRKLCPYPTTAVYNGSGSTDDQANFTCSGNIDTPAIVAADTLNKYKFETQ